MNSFENLIPATQDAARSTSKTFEASFHATGRYVALEVSARLHTMDQAIRAAEAFAAAIEKIIQEEDDVA